MYVLYQNFLNIYISRTSYFGESHDPVYNVFEKNALHKYLSRILSKKFRKAALKKTLMSLNGALLFLPSHWLFFYIAMLKTFVET